MIRKNFFRIAVTGMLSVAASLLCRTESQACTGISFTASDGSIAAARSIEWASERLDSRYVVVPHGHSFTSLAPEGNAGMTFTARYGFAGVRVMSDDLVVEGLNEKGLSAGLFFFPGYGSYEDFDPCLKSTTLCDFQVVAWALSSFSTVGEVIEALPKLHIVGLDRNVGAVHWRFADRSGRQVVLEIVDGKPHFHENEIGVLTNAPGFEWHLTNLGNYVNLKQGNAGENICLTGGPEGKKSRQGITAQNHRKLWGKREAAFQLRQEISEDKIQSLCGTVSKSFRPPDRRSFPGRKLLIPVSDLKGRKKKIFSGHFFQAGNLFFQSAGKILIPDGLDQKVGLLGISIEKTGFIGKRKRFLEHGQTSGSFS